jgi:hypothetical protein
MGQNSPPGCLVAQAQTHTHTHTLGLQKAQATLAACWHSPGISCLGVLWLEPNWGLVGHEQATVAWEVWREAVKARQEVLPDAPRWAEWPVAGDPWLVPPLGLCTPVGNPWLHLIPEALDHTVPQPPLGTRTVRGMVTSHLHLEFLCKRSYNTWVLYLSVET